MDVREVSPSVHVTFSSSFFFFNRSLEPRVDEFHSVSKVEISSGYEKFVKGDASILESRVDSVVVKNRFHKRSLNVMKTIVSVLRTLDTTE